MSRRRSNSNRNATRVRDSVAAALIDQQERHTMKIAVINFSGNVGKSTVARHLLAPPFNTVDTKSDLRKAFTRIFDHHERKSGFVLNSEAVIYENPIFEKIKPFDKSIIEIRDDPTDYVAWNVKAMEEGAPDSQRAYIRQMVALKRLANRAASELDAVFKVLVH
jgi:hypothetical protein